MRFTYDAIPGRVIFGAGSRASAADEADRLGRTRALVVASEAEGGIAEELTVALGPRVAGRFSDVVQHVPLVKARAAREQARVVNADCVITIGGGSATGFGKAITLEIDIPHIALPTTYAGSEMTTIWGLTDGGEKRTGTSPRVKPEVVIYDPELTLTLPPSIAGPSGMNALAHAVEALYGPGANPVISAIAIESIRSLHRALPMVASQPDDRGARIDALYGAYLAGVALATGGTGLHHKVCHVLGGMFDLDHGQMNAVMLGYAVAFNAPEIPEVIARIGDAIGVPAAKVPGAFHDLAAGIGASTSLKAIGMPADGIEETARRTTIAAAANVRPPTESAMRSMLEDAFDGRPPR